MAAQQTLRIDTPIRTPSRLYIALHLGVLILMAGLSWVAGLSVGQYVLLVVVAIIVYGYHALSKPVVRHLSQPPLNQRIDQHWQLLIDAGRGEGLWQAGLDSAYRYPLCIHLRFRVTLPYERVLTLTIFRDQVTADQWHKLNVLASLL